MVKALQESTGEVDPEEQDLKNILKAALNQAGKESELGSDRAGHNGLKSDSQLDQASQAQAQLSQAARSAAKAAAAATQAGAKAEASGAKAGQAEQVQVDAGKAAAGQAASRATVQTAQTTQVRGSLPSYVVRQVSDQIVQMVQKQQNTLNLKLKPANLGDLSLEITVKDGAVKAVMMAETVAAKNALDSGLDQLKQLLGQQGLKLERLEVMVNPDSQRQADFAAGDQSGSGDRRGGGSGDSDQDLASADLDETQNSGGLLFSSDGERINLFA